MKWLNKTEVKVENQKTVLNTLKKKYFYVLVCDIYIL